MSEQRKRPRILRRDDSFTATIDTGSGSSFALRSVPETEAEQSRAGGTDSPKAAPAPTPKPTGRRQRKPRKVPAGDAKSELIKLNFTIPAELTKRADNMAAAARCPSRRVAIAALNQMKQDLLETFPSVKHGDIDTRRQSDVGMRISTSWAVPAEVMAQLVEELDPLGLGQVNGLLSAWVRDRFTRHFDGYLTASGF